MNKEKEQLHGQKSDEAAFSNGGSKLKKSSVKPQKSGQEQQQHQSQSTENDDVMLKYVMDFYRERKRMGNVLRAHENRYKRAVEKKQQVMIEQERDELERMERDLAVLTSRDELLINNFLRRAKRYSTEARDNHSSLNILKCSQQLNKLKIEKSTNEETLECNETEIANLVAELEQLQQLIDDENKVAALSGSLEQMMIEKLRQERKDLISRLVRGRMQLRSLETSRPAMLRTYF